MDKALTSLELALLTTYLGVWLPESLKYAFAGKSKPAEYWLDALAGVASFIFGSVYFLFKLGGSKTPELKSMPSCFLLYGGLTAVFIAGFFLAPDQSFLFTSLEIELGFVCLMILVTPLFRIFRR